MVKIGRIKALQFGEQGQMTLEEEEGMRFREERMKFWENLDLVLATLND